MPENKDTTHDNRRASLARRKRSTQNTLGMDKDVYETYKTNLINEYVNDVSTTVSGLVAREQEKDIPLYYSRLKRWIIAAGHKIRPAEVARRRFISGGVTKGFYLRKDQAELVEQFDNVSEIMRLGLDLVFGIPTPNICLYLGDSKNVLFIIDDRTDTLEAYIVSELTAFEERT